MHLTQVIWIMLFAFTRSFTHQRVVKSTQNFLARVSCHVHTSSASGEIEYEYHTPVLRDECLDYLEVGPGKIYLDCTLGGGGHSKAILDRGGLVVALDQDRDAIRRASLVCKQYLDAGKMEIFQVNFRHAASTILNRSQLVANRKSQSTQIYGVDGVLMDLGVSSHQIDESSRGFAFSQTGPLDMRMSRPVSDDDNGSTDNHHNTGLTASDIVNEWDADSIANVLYDYGDETKSRSIAREIVAARPLTTTTDLETCIARVTPWKKRAQTLARCFQALRIVVNDEMRALDEALESMHTCVNPGGRLVVLSYHSLEDRKVKRLLAAKKGDLPDVDNGEYAGAQYAHLYSDSTRSNRGASDEDIKNVLSSGVSLSDEQRNALQASLYDMNSNKQIGPWKALFKRAQGPSKEEMDRNRRSRSAKLRVATRIVEGSEDGEDEMRNNKYGKKMGKKQLKKLEQRQQEEGDNTG